MSVWRRIVEAVQRVRRSGSLWDLFGAPTPPERTIAFTIAVVALGAKLAKADGRVTGDEVAAFRRVFVVPRDEEHNAARVFDLAREDVAGFDGYARRLRSMFAAPEHRATLEDVLDGLFHIAGADGVYDPRELAFLEDVARIFGLTDACFNRLRARHDPSLGGDPYLLLGVSRGASPETIRRMWLAHVRETHPDRMLARGVPEEAIKLATARLRIMNSAYERIKAERVVERPPE